MSWFASGKQKGVIQYLSKHMYVCIYIYLYLFYLYAYLCEESESGGVWVCVSLTEYRLSICI